LASVGAIASDKPGSVTRDQAIPFGATQKHGAFDIAIASVGNLTWPLPSGSINSSMQGFIVFVRCTNTGTEKQSLDIPLESLTVLRTDGTTADHEDENTLSFEKLLARNGEWFNRQLGITTADGKRISRWSFAESRQDIDSGTYFGFLDSSAMWGGSWSITLDSKKALVVPLLFSVEVGNAKELRWPGLRPFSLVKK
jgi:hypothetical protein